jgi:hypothetical protein
MVWTRPHDRRLGRSEYRGSGAHSRFPGSQPSGRAGASPRQGQVSAPPVRRTLARSRCHRPRPVEGRRCLTRRPGGPGRRRGCGREPCQQDGQRPRWCAARCAAPVARRARQRLAPTQVVRPSTIAPHGRLRSGERRRLVGVRRCLTRRPAGPVNRRPMVAALPVPRTMARRPRSIAAPSGAVGRGRASPLHEVGRPIPVGDRGITVMRDPPSCRGQALPDPPARRAGHHHASCGWPRSGERCRHRDASPHGAALVRSGRGSASLPPGRVAPPRGRVVARLGSRRSLSGRGRPCRTPERRVALPQRPTAQDTRQGAGCPLALGPRLLERGDEWPDRPLVATLPGQRLDEQRFDSGG